VENEALRPIYHRKAVGKRSLLACNLFPVGTHSIRSRIQSLEKATPNACSRPPVSSFHGESGDQRAAGGEEAVATLVLAHESRAWLVRKLEAEVG